MTKVTVRVVKVLVLTVTVVTVTVVKVTFFQGHKSKIANNYNYKRNSDSG